MSSVTEVLMGCGSFEIDLDPATPRSIVEGLKTFSTISVTAGRDSSLDEAAVLDLAMFSGVLRRRSNNLCTISGPSVLAWIGDEDGKGPTLIGTYDGSDPGGANALIDDIFNDGAFAKFRTNNITLGTNGLPTTTLWAATDTIWPLDVLRPWLDNICQFTGWQYRMNPDRTFDIAEAGELFTTTPTLLVVPSWLAESPTDVSYRVVAGTIRATNSNDNYATGVRLDATPYPGSADVASGAPSMPGDPGGTDAVINKLLDSSNDFDSFAEGDAAADVELLERFSTENLIDVTLPLDDPKAHVEPGDSIYVYDPLQGLQLPTITQVFALGQVMFPIVVDVKEMTWPVCEGMGVYAIQNDTGDVVDLTDFVQWGTGDTSLRVGARWPTLAEVVNGRN